MTDEFPQALADAASEGLIDLAALRAQCLAAITAGQGTIAFTTSGSWNGKTGNQECIMPPTELLSALNRAKDLMADTAVNITYSDFSDLRC